MNGFMTIETYLIRNAPIPTFESDFACLQCKSKVIFEECRDFIMILLKRNDIWVRVFLV